MARRSNPSSNGRTQTLLHPEHDPILVNAVRKLVDNFSTARRDFFNRFLDPRRSINDECGYPTTGSVDPWQYQELYDRHPIAARVVEVLPKESWQVTPEIYEQERGTVTTPFERSWAALPRQLRSAGGPSWYADQGNQGGNPIWTACLRADILAGIGSYGIILLGLDDKLPLSEPVRGVAEANSFPSDVERNGDGSPVMNEGTDANGNKVVRPRFKDRPVRNWEDPDNWYSLSNLVTNQPEDEDEEEPEEEPDEPETQSTGNRLLYLRVFPEAMARCYRFESNPTSPRFGQPVTYTITFNDPSQGQGGIGLPLATKEVHWTRVIHVADTCHTASSSEVFAVQRMRPVLDNLLDLKKIYGADGESFWKNAMMKLFFSTHPQLGGDVDVDVESLKDMMENLGNGLQQWGLLKGMGAQPIAPQVVDPTPHTSAHIEAICIKIEVPKRVFMGSEIGQLAGSQDMIRHNKRVDGRNKNWVTPGVVIPLIDRLIFVGVLPPPETSWKCWWPDLAVQTDQEKAQLAATRTQTMAQAASAGIIDSMIGLFEFFTVIMGLSDEEAKAILESLGRLAEEEGLPEPDHVAGAGKEDGPPGAAAPADEPTGIEQPEEDQDV